MFSITFQVELSVFFTVINYTSEKVLSETNETKNAACNYSTTHKKHVIPQFTE